MYSGPHSDTCELRSVHPGIPTAASNFQVHCRLAGLKDKDIRGKADVTPRGQPVWNIAASSVSALQLFTHQLLPLSLCICVALCLMSLQFGQLHDLQPSDQH